MAILPMKRISIYALLKDRNPILKLLQQLGSVQLDNLREDEFFLKNDTTKNLSDVERQMAIVEEASKFWMPIRK